MQRLRAFNTKGIGRFRDFLNELRENPMAPTPTEILTDPELSRDISPAIELDRKDFQSSIDAMEYLSNKLQPIHQRGIYYDAELWSWLSCYYFDLVCTRKAEKRFPGRDYRHIPEKGFRHRHRHLLAGKMQVYDMYKERARLLVSTELNSESSIYHELMSRQNLISNPSIIELADYLYYDIKERAPKKGAQTRVRPGNIFRFVSIMQQFDLTHDLCSMSYREILTLLPSEFKEWLPS